MRKVIIGILIVVIVLSFSYVILRLLSVGPEDNFFNQTYRAKFARHKFFRDLLLFHDYGDQRFEYLGAQNTNIVIEIDKMEGLEISETALNLLAQKISGVTGKKVSYYFSDNEILYQDKVSVEGVDQLVTLYRDNKASSESTGRLYILYLSQAESHSTELGTTYREFGIVMFDQALKNFTNISPSTFDSYVGSTALHEFGHQLGLDHNNLANCLMNVDAEVDPYPRASITNVVTDFCDYEKKLIKANLE